MDNGFHSRLMENGFFQANLLLNREMQSWVTRHMQVEGEEARDLLEMCPGWLFSYVAPFPTV